MTSNEFKKVFKYANDHIDTLHEVDKSILYGCALSNFVPVVATMEVCAAFMIEMCMQFNGQWDEYQLNELRSIYCSRKVSLL